MTPDFCHTQRSNSDPFSAGRCLGFKAFAAVRCAGAALVMLFYAGCARREEAATVMLPDGGVLVTSETRREAAKLYDVRCLPCHGPDGKGSARTGLVMPDFASPAWHAAHPDDELVKAIVGGGASIGKNAVMPANPDLASNPALQAALVQRIRGFAPPSKATP